MPKKLERLEVPGANVEPLSQPGAPEQLVDNRFLYMLGKFLSAWELDSQYPTLASVSLTRKDYGSANYQNELHAASDLARQILQVES